MAESQPLAVEDWTSFADAHGACEASASSAVADGLARLLATARDAWPDLPVARPAFFRFIGQCVAGHEVTRERIDKLHAADLYLACACAGGSDSACRAFVALYESHILAAASRVLQSESDRRAAARQVCDDMLVGREPGSAKIARYKGRGSLRAFVGVVATNTALNLAKKKAPEVARDDLEQIADGSDDPELAYLRERYADEFRASFETALSNMSDDQRLLLKLEIIEQLTVRQAALVYGRSPATTARHLTRAREALAAATLADLRARLDLTPSDVESLARMVQRSIDLSVERLLVDGS